MANGFVVNAHRYDPYKNFKFRVVLDGSLPRRRPKQHRFQVAGPHQL